MSVADFLDGDMGEVGDRMTPDAFEGLIDSLEQGDPNPGAFLGFTTDPTDMSDVLYLEDLQAFLCHNVRRHVLYYEELPDGKKRYECLEC